MDKSNDKPTRENKAATSTKKSAEVYQQMDDDLDKIRSIRHLILANPELEELTGEFDTTLPHDSDRHK